MQVPTYLPCVLSLRRVSSVFDRFIRQIVRRMPSRPPLPLACWTAFCAPRRPPLRRMAPHATGPSALSPRRSIPTGSAHRRRAPLRHPQARLRRRRFHPEQPAGVTRRAGGSAARGNACLGPFGHTNPSGLSAIPRTAPRCGMPNASESGSQRELDDDSIARPHDALRFDRARPW